MTRDEFFSALRVVVPITLAAMAIGYVIITAIMFGIGFHDAALHYTLNTLFPLILTPATIFPLAVMSQRLRAVKGELERQLRIDTLTALPNRRAFFERASAGFERDTTVNLMMVDIDHFKSVNDSYGHQTGDCVLRHVAQTIQSVVAAAPGKGGKFAARIGGEEFAVLAEGLDGAEAAAFAQFLVSEMARSPALIDGQSIPVTVSVGFAGRQSGDSPDTVLRAADRACYRAKRLGRNQACGGRAETDRSGVDPMSNTAAA